MSSSNGDTILAPIEDPNGDVPPTPKNISAKVNALQERRDQQKKLLEKSKNDDAFVPTQLQGKIVKILV